MNERIRELESQCWEATSWQAQQYGRPWFNSEKFAQLIVKECAAYIDDNIGYDDCNNTYPVSGGELKDHFGVEE